MTGGCGAAPPVCLPDGTKAFMSHYREKSVDGVLRLGNVVPDFSCTTTHGKWDSFHKWKEGKWAIIYSHPADFTPVCTSELASLAESYDKLLAMDCLLVGLSVDPLASHDQWIGDIVAFSGCAKKVQYPIIADESRAIATLYSMVDPFTSDSVKLPLTVRNVFIISPDNRLMLNLNYPASVGRNTAEILRCLQALQLTYERPVATPANWPKNNRHMPIRTPDGRTHTTTEFQAAVFLLPTVSAEAATAQFGDFYTWPVPSGKTYLRLVRAQQLGCEVVNLSKKEEYEGGTTKTSSTASVSSMTSSLADKKKSMKKKSWWGFGSGKEIK